MSRHQARQWPRGSRPGVYFLGGIHSREWGSCDILINFIEQLEQAFLNNTGLTFGTQTFRAEDIQTIVNTLDIIVFPQANPDGRNYSMNTDAMWRKNRRTAPPNSSAPGSSCTGVDLNRNYDFLWNFPVYFSPSAAIEDSTNPCDYQLYNGPSAFSEPESQNAKWIFDNFPNIGFFIDCHSYSQDILYSWGDDEDQSTDPTMNFQNPAYNGQRGVSGDAYKEYIPSSDLTTAIHLANTFHDGIQALRGTDYTVKPSFNLYPTAGTSDDYAYSRHFVDASKNKILAYTLEWGLEFQPVYSEMQNIIQEITSGLLAFCLEVRKSVTDCVIITDRNTFGKDEIDALLQLQNPAEIDVAFYIIVDGFSANELGITAASFSGTPNVHPNISFDTTLNGMSVQATALSAPDESNFSSPQRFTWTYQVIFSNDHDFTGESVPITMTASMSNTPDIPASGQAVFTLTTQPNPYEIDGPTSWLSVDLQVFNVLDGGHLSGTPGIVLNSGPLNFIRALLANTGQGYNNPGPAACAQSSLRYRSGRQRRHLRRRAFGENRRDQCLQFRRCPRALSCAHHACRQRARVLPHVPGFHYVHRIPAQYHLRHRWHWCHQNPAPGCGQWRSSDHSVFAQGRVDPTQPQGLNAQVDLNNVGPVGEMIPPDNTGAEVQVYFGCWLDINQTTPVLPDPNHPATAAGPYMPVQSIQDAIRGKHQCLVAEIHLDPPEPQITPGSTPADSDKLAQRNLNIIPVASPHQVPVTFDIKPTHSPLRPGQTPDELMIDWGRVPAGSQGYIYLPAVSADGVVKMADRMYIIHGLKTSDAHTITCAARGITYVPIPPGIGSNYAGLLTVELPPTVKRDQSFQVLARQITNISAPRPTPPPPPPPIPQIHASATPAAVIIDLIKWRKVLGSFQLTIPVETTAALLGPEERLLSVLRWIAKGIPHDNRWHPVFHRYLEQIAGRVSSLGGDPGKIAPSPSGNDGLKPPPHKRHEERVCVTGKVAGLIFDHFGDFEGFLLDTEDGERKYLSRERDLKDLVERAWRERLRITVCTDHDEPHRPRSIIVREPPALFEH